MSATTKINWTDATWNPVTGCTAAGVGFFFKQWGTGLKKESYPVRFYAAFAGWRSLAQNGGRLLDGQTHDELCWDTAGRART